LSLLVGLCSISKRIWAVTDFIYVVRKHWWNLCLTFETWCAEGTVFISSISVASVHCEANVSSSSEPLTIFYLFFYSIIMSSEPAKTGLSSASRTLAIWRDKRRQIPLAVWHDQLNYFRTCREEWLELTLGLGWIWTHVVGRNSCQCCNDEIGVTILSK